MIPADLVRARRRGDRLVLNSLRGRDLGTAQELAQRLVALARESVDLTWEEVSEILGSVHREAKHEKLWAGLKKLVLDSCEFESPVALEATALRKLVFERASAARAGGMVGEGSLREQILSEVAAELSASTSDVERGLFSDLKGAQTLKRPPSLEAESLVSDYELAQIQGVLLKAVRLRARVHFRDPDGYRGLFFKLKFRQLLYRLEQIEDGYEIEIEGPYSLFESVTKYGLQLALIVPALLSSDRGKIQAELRWGKERKPLEFEHEWETPSSQEQTAEPPLRSEVSQLLSSFQKLKSPYAIEIADRLLEIPGVGLTIPDVKFERPGGTPVFLEILGFWSRDAVWRRIEWAQAGSHEKVIFAASSRLRVKKEALPEGHEASLYVYKGAMSARAILAQVQSLDGG